MFGECVGKKIRVVRLVEMKISKEILKYRLKKSSKQILEHLESSEFLPFFEETFTSNDSRIVKNHFQHTLKVPETLSERQGMRR